MDQFKNHNLKFINKNKFASISCKNYKCTKCNYNFYMYDDDNYESLWFYDGKKNSEGLSCEEMQIKKLLE